MTGAAVLASCGGRSDDAGGDPSPPSVLPQLSIGSARVDEGNSGNTALVLPVTLSGAASSSVTVVFATADGTALAGGDYTASSGTLTIAAGTIAANITVSINGDTDVEGDEIFTVTLSNVSAAATLGTAGATATITNDDVAPPPLDAGLNDTGITTCSNGVNNGLACNSAAVGTDAYPGQDAEHGRGGFSFTKLDASGVPLADQSAAFNVTPWHCVFDNITGLTWEVKTDDEGLRDKDWTLTWFASTGLNDGGDRGTENGGTCVDTQNCDTEKYRQAVNAAMLCGRDDWRLPLRSELLSIVHYGAVSAPFIDAASIPQSSSVGYWSGSARGGDAWTVSLMTGDTRFVAKDNRQATRLVSGGGL